MKLSIKIATFLRKLANKISPETKSAFHDMTIDRSTYQAKKVTIGREISCYDLHKAIVILSQKGAASHEDAIKYCQEQEKEWITKSIFKGIEENNLIDFDFDDNRVIGKLYVYVKS